MIVERDGRSLVPPYDDAFVMAGQGTAALELLEEVEELNAVVTRSAGAGCSRARQRSCVRSVRSARLRCGAGGSRRYGAIARSRRARHDSPAVDDRGRRATRDSGPVDVSGRARARRRNRRVEEHELVDAMRLALTRMKLLVEPTGALGLAAALSKRMPADARRVGIVISGGNVDLSLLASLLA